MSSLSVIQNAAVAASRSSGEAIDHLISRLNSQSDEDDLMLALQTTSEEDDSLSPLTVASEDMMECPCCSRIWDGNAQCACMCSGCENCDPQGSWRDHEIESPTPSPAATVAIGKSEQRRLQKTMSSSSPFLLEVAECLPCSEQIGTKKLFPPQGAVECGYRKKTKVFLPQLPESERPVGKQWEGKTYEAVDGGFKCILGDCGKVCKGKRAKAAIQEHCKHHFPPEYSCQGCGGTWHLLTEFNQHFMVKCEKCGKKMKKGSVAGHKKTCQG